MLILIAITFTLISFFFSQKKPDWAFWTFLFLMFDPGGFFSFYFGGEFFMGANFSDVFFILCFLPLFSSKVNKFKYRDNDLFLNFFHFMIFLSVYYIFIYGILTPVIKGYPDWGLFFLRKRLAYLAPFIMIPVYIFTIRSLKYFYKLIAITGSIIFPLFLLSVLTGIRIIPYFTISRYAADSGILRIVMYGYGLIHLILNMSIIVYMLNLKVSDKKKLLLGAVSFAIIIILTLTRREYVFRTINILVIFYFVYKVFNLKLNKLVIRVGSLIIITYIMLTSFFPKYLEYSSHIVKDVYFLLKEGTDSKGREDYRMTGTGQIQFLKSTIKENPVLGTGYLHDWFDDQTGTYKGLDNPFCGALANFVVLGIFVFSMLYIKILIHVRKVFKFLKLNAKLFRKGSEIPLLFTILLMSYFVTKIFFQIFNLFGELLVSSRLIVLCIYIAIFIGSYTYLKKYINEKK